MKVAVIQLNSKANKQENLRKTIEFIREAVESGAELISLPRSTLIIWGKVPRKKITLKI